MLHSYISTHTHSAFARYPDGEVEHYYCAKQNIAKELSSPQPSAVTEQEPSLLPPSGRELYLDTNPLRSFVLLVCLSGV